MNRMFESSSDSSCRVPLLALFAGAGAWLCLSSVLGLMASIKFHQPNFLADCEFLTYGRVYPASTVALLYGFCIPAGLAAALWLFVRLGRCELSHGFLVLVGALFWNLGVLLGVGGILGGDSTGFINFELPRYAGPVCFAGYLMISVWGLITFHHRTERALYASQWFLFIALFWFVWIFSTAYLMLIAFPTRGVAQAVINWWFSHNFQFLWLTLVGLGAIFYFVPKLTRRNLYSHYLALVTFWVLVLFGGLGGVPATAPVPSWITALSIGSSGLLLVPILTLGLNLGYTLLGTGNPASPATAEDRGNEKLSLSFVLVGAAAFILAGLISLAVVVLDTQHLLPSTWFARGQAQLHVYGFFAMTLFGAAYYILPRIAGLPLAFPKLAGLHFWLALLGIALSSGVLTIGGLVEAAGFARGGQTFVSLSQSTLPFLRVATMGDLLFLAGHLIFLLNVLSLILALVRGRVTSLFTTATTDLFKVAEAKS
jgi:cytochrome c oxidase cbb3-type subunit 1